MHKIGDFSTLSKVTVKTLRYYEQEGLLIPIFVDKETGYRFYETNQLPQLAKIISLRQIGLSIENIKNVLAGADIFRILENRKIEVQNQILLSNNQLLQINNLLGGENMNYQVVLKELPDFTIYYKQGVIKDFSEITQFILSSAQECLAINPDIKCVEPGYCYVNYLDGEYKEKDIKIRYAQAVEEAGIENDIIKFEKLTPVTGACIYHKGSYKNLREAYSYILKWIEDNGYEIAEPIRERYIDGVWNKENEDEWLTEIQIPVKSK